MKDLMLICMFLLLVGCVHALPGTEPYRPGGKIEASFMQRADFSVFPNDVRSDLIKHLNKTVAWSGVITDVQLEEPTDRPHYAWWKVKVSHRYFNWIKDRNIYQIDYYLSSKGEGEFIIMIGVERYSEADREKKIEETQKALEKGNMIWAYGHPDKIENGVIRLNGGFANTIDKAHYNGDKMNYGRIVPRDGWFN